ncbi:hypothetical protein L873DRAFT_1842573 [Choiromyces venosus 120613-1]|uniref:Uncharacterized protein n=1 Tax=Choiromyces venosus 120613-1 TaxID=1336337 RepID=A0A3N4JSA6_9PEZI|nr:hypothetical protein L873DRAFT_1842573 [Choiromyces venosus 120613-1]
MTAYHASFTIENIQSSFQNTGLSPINRSIVITKVQATQANVTPPNPSNHSTYPNPPLQNNPTTSPQSLSMFTILEINNLEVPSNRQDIEKQELMALTTLPQNDPIA